ncbi:hypothetical protein Esti_003934 [Eimeria stiedai]
MVLGKWMPSLASRFGGAPDRLLAEREQEHPSEDAASLERKEEQQRVNGPSTGPPHAEPEEGGGPYPHPNGVPGGPSGLRWADSHYEPVLTKGLQSPPPITSDDDSSQQQQQRQQRQEEEEDGEEDVVGLGGLSMSRIGSTSPPLEVASCPDPMGGDSGRASPRQATDKQPIRPRTAAGAAAACAYAADGGGISPRQQVTVRPHYSAQSEASEAVSSSVALDVEALDRAVYVRSPLGSFKEPLIHMKLREFSRAHHGVFGTCTLKKVSAWILTTQFLTVLVGLMACPKEVSQLAHQPFIRVNSTEGGVFIYSFCSLALTYLLALKFAGPRMLACSANLSYLMVALLICIAFSIQLIRTTKGVFACDAGQPLGRLKTASILSLNVVYTQLQLLMFVCSAVNTLYWPRIYKWWFCSYSIRLWQLVKKHKIKLDLPEAVKRSVDAAGPRARNADEEEGAASTGMYMEAHGHSFKQWLHASCRQLMFWRPKETKGLGPVSVVFYVGQVDEDCRPHGFGRWQSDAFHGESIVGYWNHGMHAAPAAAVPASTAAVVASAVAVVAAATSTAASTTAAALDVDAAADSSAASAAAAAAAAAAASAAAVLDAGQPMGPFKSREFGTGSGFMCIRIAWCKAKKGVLRFDTTFGISDAECCVSGAFFRKFPRVTMFGMESDLNEEGVQRQLMSFANDLMGYSKPTATLTVPQELGDSLEELKCGCKEEACKVRSGVDLPVIACVAAAATSVDLTRAHSGPKLVWQPTRIPAAVRRRAQGLFKWRSEHQRSTASKAEHFRNAMKLVIDRMDPHLPNFGIADKTELNITVDAEHGLYVGGWVPATGLLHVGGPKTRAWQLEHAKGDLLAAETQADFSGPEESAEDAAAVQAGPDRAAAAPAVRRKVSSSQTRAKGLHQRLGHALQVKHNLKQVDLRRPFRGSVHGHKSIEDFLQERPRIRRQTCDLFSKGLTIKVHHPLPRPFVPASSASDASLKPPTGSIMRHGRGSDILDPSNQLTKPFAWTEVRHHDILILVVVPLLLIFRAHCVWDIFRCEVPELRVEGWKRAEEAGLPEAMIFVHGYNTNDVQSMQIMAQMAAFGNFPSYIKPFLFTWPSGENFLEFFDASENARNPQLHAAFTDFIRSLRDNGEGVWKYSFIHQTVKREL